MCKHTVRTPGEHTVRTTMGQEVIKKGLQPISFRLNKNMKGFLLSDLNFGKRDSNWLCVTISNVFLVLGKTNVNCRYFVNSSFWKVWYLICANNWPSERSHVRYYLLVEDLFQNLRSQDSDKVDKLRLSPKKWWQHDCSRYVMFCKCD